MSILDVANKYVAFRDAKDDVSAIAMLDESCTFESPVKTCANRSEIAAFFEEQRAGGESEPVFDWSFVQTSEDTWTRRGTVRKMMMNWNIEQVITFRDGRIVKLVHTSFSGNKTSILHKSYALHKS